MGVSKNGGTQQLLVFLLKMIILGCFGVPPFKETPISTFVLRPGCSGKAPDPALFVVGSAYTFLFLGFPKNGWLDVPQHGF